jgi:hypothetical protein
MVMVFERVEHPGERHLTVAVVVAVAFAVGGDMDDLRVGAVGLESAEEALGEAFAAVQEAFEGNGAGARSIVEEDGDGATLVEAHEIRPGRVDRSIGCVGPGRLRRRFLFFG